MASAALISLAFRHDGLLVTGNGISGKGAAERPGEVRLWNVRDRARARLLDTATTPSVMAVAAHPTRDLLVATGAEGKMAWWTVEGGRRHLRSADTAEGADPRLRFALPKPWEARYFLPGTDRPVLMAHRWTEGTEDHAFRLWDFGGDAKRPPVPGAEIAVKASDVRTAVSADGRLLVVGGWAAGTVQVWDIRDVRRPVRRATLPAVPVAGWESLFFLGDRGLAVVDRVEPGRGRPMDLRIWDLTDPAEPVKGPLLKDAAVGQAGYVPSTRLLMHDAPAQRTQLWDMRDIRNPGEAALLPAASGGYQPVGKGVLATTLTDGTVKFWDVSDPYKPREMDEMRFDRALTDIRPSPDGRWVLTGDPYRIWAAEKDGRWRTPAIATVEGVKDLKLLPDGSPFMAVVPDGDLEGRYSKGPTYLIDFDTDRIYHRLCTTHPLSVEKKQWKALLPHLDHRPSCD
ncbi:WD40 repeat domain-containing protein [Streptomyces sp. NBC_01224]|uniref:WD40 repeat domain-containing protein n=1 Tax=Streptomyces sp. NBC_01224 TaxID=2903783 RepID=UPI002E1167D4|nr:WD40 repeat domain-containing protein [Streptomyces sp. NBC_01224]